MSSRDGHAHLHGRPHTARAESPTWSLLRLSVLQRLAGAGVFIGLLWILVGAVLVS